MKFLRVIPILLLCYSQLFGQSQGPKSGAQPQSFTAAPSDLGFLNGSINTVTGQVEFSMPVLSLKSKGSLEYTLKLDYSSNNVKNQVNLRNREAPTSFVGLGWSLNYPRIVCDHKGTATREDDDFYLSDNGGMTKLIGYSIPNDEWTYVTKPYQPWKIVYTKAEEKWTITHEDGTKYVYGNIATGATNHTLQYMVAWGNWIGNAANASGQSSLVYIWNLSSIEDVWGDKITFTYLTEEEKVYSPSSTQFHTKACYLSQVTAANGDYIKIVSLGKQVGGPIEYVDPHTEGSEPDAYQEKYETRYLAKATLYNANNEVLSDAQFTHGSYGSAEYYKRQLASFTIYNAANHSLNGYTFEYESGTAASNNTGALKKVTSPNKGFVQYTYNTKTLSATARDFHVDPVTNYAEPRLFIGEDYVVVARRYYDGVTHSTGSQTVRLDLYTWENGQWMPWAGNYVTLNSVQLEGSITPYKHDFQIIAGKNFFATLHEEGTSGIYKLNAFGRSDAKPGDWVLYTRSFASASSNGSVNHADVQDPVLCAGENFLLVGSRGPSAGSVQQYVYSFENEAWSEAAKITANGSYNYVAGNNYYIAHKYDGTDQISLYYRKQGANWGSVSFPSSIVPNTNAKSNWFAGNTFAVMIGVGPPDKYIYNWQKDVSTGNDYGLITATTAQFPGFTDNCHVNIINNTMIGVAEQGGAYMFRYTGTSWVQSGLLDYYGPNTYMRNLISYGDDYVLRPRPGSAIALKQISLGSNLFVDQVTASSSTTQNYYACIAGNNFATFSGSFYFRQPNGTWTADPNSISYSWFHGTSWNDTYIQAGLDFIATGDPYYTQSGYTANSYAPFAARIKNGALVPTVESFLSSGGKAQRIWDRANNLITSPQTGASTLVTYVGPAGIFNHMEDASEFYLYRSVQDGFKGSLTTMVVERFDTYDGTTLRYNHVVYDETKATMDATGTTAFFNKVTTFPDDDTNNTTKPFGYTEQYFFNGMKSADLSANASYPTVGGNSGSNFKWFLAMPYKNYTYDNLGTLKTKDITDYEKNSLSTGQPLIRPVYQRSEGDGRVSVQSTTYNSFNMPSSVVTSNPTSGAFNTTTVDITYFNTAYDVSNKYNMIGIPVSQKKTVDGNLAEIAATRYKAWATDKFGAVDKYVWKTGASETAFSVWSTASTPTASSWKLHNKITQLDLTRGLPTEAIDVSGVYVSTIWDATRPLVLAEVVNAQVNQVAYKGFEDCPSCSSEFFAGSKSNYNSNVSISGLASGTYKLTYWSKSTVGGSWSLTETTFTGTGTTITGTSIWIDEVRVHPADATMTSYSYDKWSNKISENGPNNFVNYLEYDEFNRLKLVRDKDRNIIESYIYNVKN